MSDYRGLRLHKVSDFASSTVCVKYNKMCNNGHTRDCNGPEF